MAVNISGTQFEKYKDRLGVRAHWVIHLTDGTSDWYFSDISMDLTDGTVYPLLTEDPVVKEMADPYTKRWGVSNIRMKISNIPYLRQADGTIKKFSDLITDLVVGNSVKAYYILGEEATQLSDGLLRFSGIVIEHPSYNEKFVSFVAVDKGKTIHRELPTEIVSDGLITVENYYINLNKKIPLVYGKYTFDIDDLSGDGLAVGQPFHIQDCLISMRPLNAITTLWFKKPQIPDLCKFNSPTTYTAYNTNYGRVDPNTTPTSTAYLYPDGSYSDIGYNYNPANPADVLKPTDWESGFDRDDQFGTEESWMVFHMPDYAAGTGANTANGIGVITGLMYLDVISWGDAFIDVIWIGLIYDTDGAIIDNIAPIEGAAGSIVAKSTTVWYEGYANATISRPKLTSIREDIGWHFASGSSNVDRETVNGAMIHLHAQNNAGGDGIINNSDMFDTYQVRLRYNFTPVWQDIVGYFCECEGETYGSWISSRSSNYSSGAVIEDPAGIVESILRNDLGLVDVDIDLPSFINAENTSMKHRVNIHDSNKDKSDRIIRKIIEQSTFMFFYSGAGKARLIALNDASPTTTATIPWTHIRADSLNVFKSKWLVNILKASTRYKQEIGDYSDLTTSEDAVSTGRYGDRIFNAKWNYISGASVTELIDHLCDSSGQNFWARFRNIVVLNVHPGYEYLEPGDWIELDAATIDPHMECYDTSWSGKQFLIYDLTISKQGVSIKALEIN